MRRILIPLIFGLAGAAVLISLGVWQVQRLAWKEAVLTDIETRITAAPVDLPDQFDAQADRYLPVAVTGVPVGPELHVLVSRKQAGAGYRIIQAFEVADRRIMVDHGFVKTRNKDAVRGQGDAQEGAAQAPVTLSGNLHWPDEVDGYTPEADQAKNIWFARDVPVMANVLGTEPVLLVVRHTSQSDPLVTPLPVDITGIPNDHLNYAITWFSLAVIWLIMTGYFLWRMGPGARQAQPKKGKVT